jgi:hypothetical protein
MDNVIEKWFYRINEGEQINILQANRLIRNLLDYYSNKRMYHNIISFGNENDNISMDYEGMENINLNDCIYFRKVEKQEYQYFMNNGKIGFLSCYISSAKQFLGDVAHLLFNEIKVENNNSPLFSGIVKHNKYLGSINENHKNGFGLFKYDLPISRHYEWNNDYKNPDTNAVVEYEHLFYSGTWANGMKHGVGIILKYNTNFYSFSYVNNLEDRLAFLSNFNDDSNKNVFFFIGLWQNDTLIKILNRNDAAFNTIEKLINFFRASNANEFIDSEESELDEDYKESELEEAPNEFVIEAIPAKNILLEEISLLFKNEVEKLVFPVLEAK